MALTLSIWVMAALLAPALDFEFFRARVQPIFLGKRPGHARCYVCHSRGTAFRLQRLSPGSASWNEDESRRNFEAAERLVAPGDPRGSRLLTIALSEEAGGAPFHPGGKHWASESDPEWQTLSAWVKTGSTAAGAPLPAPTPVLDFDLFRARVEPIFLRKRAGHARCSVCHSRGTPFRLQPLSPGSASWSEAESRRNFEAVQRLVLPGDPLASRLLTIALAEEAGGAAFHPGGKHWESQNDPEWQSLAEWVRGRR